MIREILVYRFTGGMAAASLHAVHNIVDLPPMLGCQGALSCGDFSQEIGDAMFVSQVGENGFFCSVMLGWSSCDVNVFCLFVSKLKMCLQHD